MTTHSQETWSSLVTTSNTVPPHPDPTARPQMRPPLLPASSCTTSPAPFGPLGPTPPVLHPHDVCLPCPVKFCHYNHSLAFTLNSFVPLLLPTHLARPRPWGQIEFSASPASAPGPLNAPEKHSAVLQIPL